MRRYISALLFLLAISLAGCATAGNPLSPENGGTVSRLKTLQFLKKESGQRTNTQMVCRSRRAVLHG